MEFSYECPCCGETINVSNPFDVSCPCCGGKSGISFDFDNDKRNKKAEEATKAHNRRNYNE